MPMPIGAHIEIIEPWPSSLGSFDPETLPAIKPRVVKINGTDVGTIKRGGIEVNVLDDDALEVTLTLLARKVEIKAEPGLG